MTQKEFVKNVKNSFALNVLDVNESVYMNFVNLQEGEIWSGVASRIGFDSDGSFYIEFDDVNCLAYYDELECNTEDAWDMLWDAVVSSYPMPFVEDECEKHDFKVGDKVYWNGRRIEDYPEDQQAELLTNRFVVIGVNGEYMDSIIEITDCYTDAEVTASELVHCKSVKK
jgi:hypothetical protein